MAAPTGKRSPCNEDEPTLTRPLTRPYMVVVFMNRSDAASNKFDEWLIVRGAHLAPEDLEVIKKYVQLVHTRGKVPEAGELDEPDGDAHDEAVYGPWLAMRNAHLLYHTLRLVFNGTATECADDDLRWRMIKDYAHHAGLEKDDPSFKAVVKMRCDEFARRVKRVAPYRDEMRDRAIDIRNVIVRYTVPVVLND